ncbi:hypothetical protein GGR54DRAFT_627466 [Hypoxylon sp. NC1633]|nr:hypothetical protein GGR54DRAFT_627466 [Hypoxylon sp. NC1633]
MDPFAEIGLAANIVAFVDFGFKLLSTARSIHESTSGVSKINSDLSSKALQLQRLATDLEVTKPISALSEKERSLLGIAAECKSVSADLERLLNKLKAKDPKSKRQAFRAAIHDMWKKDEKSDLEHRLSRCRDQLTLELLNLTRSESIDRLNKIIEHGQANKNELQSLTRNIESLRLGSHVTCLGSEAVDQIRSLLNLSNEAILKVRQARILDGLRFEMMNERFEDIEEAHNKTFDWIFDGGIDTVTDSDSGSYESDSTDETKSEGNGDNDDDLEGDGNYDANLANDQGGRRTMNEDRELVSTESSSTASSLGAYAQGLAENTIDGATIDGAQHRKVDFGDDASFEWFDIPRVEENTASTKSDAESAAESDAESDEGPAGSPGSLPALSVVRTDQDGQNAVAEARDTFITWLEQGTGIFYISGKPGSGKSTLMKYLTRHHKTRTHLEVWAGKKKLVVGKFFFWKPGSTLQKNLKGLVRQLLHCLLAECPGLIPLAFPLQWEESIHMENIHIEHHECKKAFEKLISTNEAIREHRFTLFIDGLDEFEGNHADLIRQLFAWFNQTDNVKLCISSREWAIFQDAFQYCPKFRLHDLTRSDIQHFVEDRLREMHLVSLTYEVKGEKEGVDGDDDGRNRSSTDLATKLGNAIVEESDGVFLWVTLVLRHVENGVANGDRIKDLMRLIRSLPTELEPMFQQLLDSVPPNNRRLAYGMLSMAHFCLPYDSRVFLMQYSFMEKYVEDKNFAMNSDVKQFTAKENRQSLERARKRIYGVCKGLLELRQAHRVTSELSNKLGSVVHLTHRSITEFLESQHFKEKMDSELHDFDPFDAYCQTWLGQLKRARFTKSYISSYISPPIAGRPLGPEGINSSQYQTTFNYMPFAYSEEPSLRQDLEMKILQYTDFGNPKLILRFLEFLNNTYHVLVDLKWLTTCKLVPRNNGSWHPPVKYDLDNVVVLACIQLGFHEYLLSIRSELIECHISIWPIMFDIENQRSPESSSRLVKTLRVLFDHGASEPDCPLPSKREPGFHTLLIQWCTRVSEYNARLAVIAFMLYQGANPRFTIVIGKPKYQYKTSKRIYFLVCFKSVRLVLNTGYIYEEETERQPGTSENISFLSADSSTLDIISTYGRRIDLKALVSIWFPDHCNVLQQVIDWILELGVPVDTHHRAQLQSLFGLQLRPLFDERDPNYPGWKTGLTSWPNLLFQTARSLAEELFERVAEED